MLLKPRHVAQPSCQLRRLLQMEQMLTEQAQVAQKHMISSQQCSGNDCTDIYPHVKAAFSC